MRIVYKGNYIRMTCGEIGLVPRQHSRLSHRRPTSEMPFEMAFCWQSDDGPFIVLFGSSMPSSPKENIKFGPPLTKLSGSAHVLCLTDILEISIEDNVFRSQVCTFNIHGFSWWYMRPNLFLSVRLTYCLYSLHAW